MTVVFFSTKFGSVLMTRHMKLGLICSGLSHLPRQAEEGAGEGVARLPRVFLARDSQQFLPDFALLLLVDELVMDRTTFAGLIRGLIQSGPTVPLLARFLHQEGFIRLENLEAASRARESQLAAVLQENLRSVESWVPTVREWFLAWHAHYQGIQTTLRPSINLMREAVAAGRTTETDCSQQTSKFIHDTGGRYQMAKFYAEESLPPEGGCLDESHSTELRTLLTEQLLFAHGNLHLCQEFGAALHDWCDLEPFYREIISRTSKSAQGWKFTSDAPSLFELPLPEFSFWHPDNVLRALNDPQVRHLRKMIKTGIAARKPLEHAAVIAVLDSIRRFDSGITTVRLVSATIAAAPKRRLRRTGVVPREDNILADSLLLLTSRSLDAQRPNKSVS